MKRRDLVKGGLALGVGAMVGGCTPGSRFTGPPLLGGRRARNIIFYAYDGFGYEDLATAGFYAKRKLGRPLHLEHFLSAGAAGMMLPHSLTSVVTDSSAASTAWATGRKVVNGAVSMYPDDRKLTTILDLAKQAGKATGLISTARITHATPACFAARVPHRDMEDEIAADYLHLAPNVLLGGGGAHFDPAAREDGRDLFGEFAAMGYDVVGTKEELDASSASRILGTFSGTAHMPYEIDRRFQGAGGPSLAEMTRKGLEVLSGSGEGFVVQVEAGRIDHANHQNDVGAMLWEVLAADEALQVIRDFADRNPDTLVIFASDHDTGGGATYGFGPGYSLSSKALDTLERRRASFPFLRSELLSRAPSADDVRTAIRDHLGIPVSMAEAEAARRVLLRESSPSHPTAQGSINHGLGFVLSSMTQGVADRPSHNYATGNHTAALVPAAMYSAGLPATSLGVVDNTELFDWMTGALRIDYRNSAMSEEEALLLGGGVAGRRDFAMM